MPVFKVKKIACLISVFNQKGEHINDFGDKFSPSSIFGNEYKDYDQPYLNPLNRAYMAVDHEDNLWIGFYHMPVICKYDHNGQLIMKKIIALPEIDKLIDAAWHPYNYPEFLSYGNDSITLGVLISDIYWHNKRARLYHLIF